MKLLMLVLCTALLTVDDIHAATTPDQRTKEQAECVEGPYRGAVCLNGLWRLQPAERGAATPAATGWGWMPVPGSWRNSPLPPLKERGTGPAWDGFGGDSPAAWYERDVTIPTGWTGRAVVLDLRRVATDAVAWVDDREAGRVAWPGGEIDLTALVRPGATHRLRLLVVAAASSDAVVRYHGTDAGQVVKEKAVITRRGLIGDVWLASRPAGGRIADLAVRTSTRRQELALDLELAGITAGTRLEVRAEAHGAGGRRFAGAGAVGADGRLTVAWPWPDAVTWDAGRPHLYRLAVAVAGPGVADAVERTIGFREFWIEGRRFLLNGTEIRLRPAMITTEGLVSGTPELVRAAVAGMLRAGFNSYEMWPWNRDERGVAEFDRLWCEEADRQGLLLMAPVLDVLPEMARWREPGVREDWERRMARCLRPLRNHPSVVLWAAGANRFCFGQDQNPLVMGRRDARPADPLWERDARIGEESLAAVRRLDPTRPAFTHAGAMVGDLYTLNNYLCLTQLQEREEWLSAWATAGDQPLMMVEFGTPFYSTFQRGRRRGYHLATTSEPLFTEHCAAVLGPSAYALESADYRRTLADSFERGQTYRSWHALPVARLHPAFVQVEALFTRNTWRSWRTWGITGGMIPWDLGYGWDWTKFDRQQQVPLAADPQRPGLTPATVSRDLLGWLEPAAMPPNAAGRELIAANGPTLAWIGGAPAFTDKTHSYRAGGALAKQAVLINDQRTAQPFRLRWRVATGGTEVAAGEARGELAPAENRLLPIAATLPAAEAAIDGAVELEAEIGGIAHRDRLTLRIFPRQQPGGPVVALADPVGDTAALLAALGVPCTTWDGRSGDRLVVVGRQALARGLVDPAALAACARAGGRVLVMAQDPAWQREACGLRVSRQLQRRVFATDPAHPLLAGLVAADLVDWAGSSRLLPPVDAPTTLPGDVGRTPLHGWRWGATHAVASAAVEVPHRAGWRPLLACGFDLAFSPLLELDLGAGRVWWCGLDLEDHAAADPAAERLVRNLLAYADGARGNPRCAVAYLGGDTGAAQLAALGVRHQRHTALPAPGILAVIGGDAIVDDGALRAFLAGGGRALLLAGSATGAALGLARTDGEAPTGAITVPAWDWCRGLGAGDLRQRGPVAWRLFAPGPGVAAGGLLAEVREGTGLLAACQLDPAALDADRLTWRRTTRWRQTRALAQILANLGAQLDADARVLEPQPGPHRIDLAGTWQAALTAAVPAAASPVADPGMSASAAALVAGNASFGQTAAVPSLWEVYGGAWAATDGEAVFTREIELPPAWAGRDLVLRLGPVDDYDRTFVNGVEVGATPMGTCNAWSLPRSYRVPAALVRPGRNRIAVRVWDQFGGGGLAGDEQGLWLEPAPAAAGGPPALYHPDWRDDAPLGDDPERYNRW